MVASLTPHELSILRRVVSRWVQDRFCNQILISSRHDHFDLMKLPLEIREIIYFYLLVPADGRTSSNSLRFRYCPPILRTCTTIYHEATKVLFQHSTFYCSVFIGWGQPFSRKDEVALAGFRNIDISLYLEQWHIDETKAVDYGPVQCLEKLVQGIESRGDGVSVHLTLTVHPAMTGRYKFDSNKFTPGDEFKFISVDQMKEAWMRAHMRRVVSSIMLHLEERALYVNLITNREQVGYEIRVKRTSTTAVLCKIPSARLQGKCPSEVEDPTS